MERSISPEDMREYRCCVCNQRFQGGVVEAIVLSDDNVHMGSCCPSCLEHGPDWIGEKLRSWARCRALLSRMAVAHAEAVSQEVMKECPTAGEALMLEKIWQTPRYRNADEAQAAWERGEW